VRERRNEVDPRSSSSATGRRAYGPGSGVPLTSVVPPRASSSHTPQTQEPPEVSTRIIPPPREPQYQDPAPVKAPVGPASSPPTGPSGPRGFAPLGPRGRGGMPIRGAGRGGFIRGRGGWRGGMNMGMNRDEPPPRSLARKKMLDGSIGPELVATEERDSQEGPSSSSSSGFDNGNARMEGVEHEQSHLREVEDVRGEMGNEERDRDGASNMQVDQQDRERMEDSANGNEMGKDRRMMEVSQSGNDLLGSRNGGDGNLSPNSQNLGTPTGTAPGSGQNSRRQSVRIPTVFKADMFKGSLDPSLEAEVSPIEPKLNPDLLLHPSKRADASPTDLLASPNSYIKSQLNV